jgi:serine/threonine-protein kinase
MGEVYRARDTKLGRDVALKILPDAFSDDPERLARFRREAQVLAALNHPHIAAIYGLDEALGVQFLVLELVEGGTLGDRLASGPLRADDALGVAQQVVRALEAAHERGIVHRDLKPANIAFAASGQVKVLDFGLAKAVDTVPGRAEITHSPTLSIMATQAGIILGTAAYMSPEQAKGLAADHRSDVFSFGIVLYEMLTGRKPFQGDTAPDVLASVLARDVDFTQLPANLDPRLRGLLARCLAKDPRQRWQAIGDLAVDLHTIATTPLVSTSSDAGRLSRRARVLLLVASGVALGLLAAFPVGFWILRSTAAATGTVRFTITPPGPKPLPTGGRGTASPYRDVLVSPDGNRVIYNLALAGNLPDEPQLWVRALDQLDGVQLPRAVGGFSGYPFMSPDGKWIGYFSSGELRKISVDGGPDITICRLPGALNGFRGGSWGPDDAIVLATDDSQSGLLRVSADGGEPTVLTRPDREHGEEDHLFPAWLPGGRAVLFTITSGGSIDSAVIAVLDLVTGQRKVLVHGATSAQYVESGYLVYASSASLMAVRFDPDKLEVLGDPVRIVDSVLIKSDGAAEFSVSRNGTLVYIPNAVQTSAQHTLVWADRQGHEESIGADPHNYVVPRVSPDDTRIAVDVRDRQGDVDIWFWGLAHSTFQRMTSDGADLLPVWMPDSRQFLFSSIRSGRTRPYRQSADGTGSATPLTDAPQDGLVVTSVMRDGSLAVAQPSVNPSNLLLLNLKNNQPPKVLIPSKSTIRNGEIAPNGQWLAYESLESGSAQVYVRPFPDVDAGLFLVSTRGGTQPAWGRNGQELFYVDAEGYLTAVPVQTTSTFTAGPASRVLQRRYFSAVARAYDVSADPQKFLMIKEAAVENTPLPSMVVALNWVNELKARVPTR